MEPQLGLGDALIAQHAPLADRMRPRSLDEVIGQPNVAGPASPLRRALAAGKPHSMIFWGPPGVGKTTTALALAGELQAGWEQMNAVTDGIKELREVMARAKSRRRTGERTVLFIDEIARWNRAQQDALLPFVEDGTVLLVGATTENPGFEINRALLSRLKVYVLQPLTDADMDQVIARAFSDSQRGLGDRLVPYTLTPNARDLLLLHAGGDARTMLNALEACSALQPDGGEIDAEIASQATGRRQLAYGKGRDEHYDTVSAFIKSIRGSDPDAALYWLARMHAGGEDPVFVARRLVISASEDIGMGAPGALAVATAGMDAVKLIGAPEAWINLAHVTVYLATRPTNRSAYEGWRAAQELVDREPAYEIPSHLRNAPTTLAKQMGHGRGYDSARQAADGQQFLPDQLAGQQLYRPQP